ncbi:MAG: MFS transporter [Gammaproteobacteria bacterium]|jgi:sugar phosphate permease
MFKNNRNYAWFIWVLAAGFFFAEYVARVAPSVMVPHLMRAFQVNAFQLGSLSAFFYYAYVAMQIPAGVLVDKYGPHKLLTILAVFCGVSVLIFAGSHDLRVAEISRFIMGFSAAFAFVGALKLASVWFPPSRFGFLAGSTQAIGMLGAAIGEGAVSVLVEHIGWRDAMYLVGFILVVLGIMIGFIVKDKPTETLSPLAPKAQCKKYSLLKGLLIVLKNPQTWINGIFVGFLYAPTAAFAELWGPAYLHRVYDLRVEVAASAVSMIFIGWMIISPIAGWVSDRIGRRKPVMLVSVIASLFCMSCVLYLPDLSKITIFILLFLYGLSNVGVATSFAVACECNPRPIAGTSMSFANMASVIIGAGFQPIIGWILDLNWNHKILHGVRHYSMHDFRIAMLLLPLCFIISFVAWCYIKETANYSVDF